MLCGPEIKAFCVQLNPWTERANLRSPSEIGVYSLPHLFALRNHPCLTFFRQFLILGHGIQGIPSRRQVSLQGAGCLHVCT